MEGECDQNGNYCFPTKPKESVLQILSDTLRRAQSSTVDSSQLSKADYTEVQLSEEGDPVIVPPDSSFNPSDRICNLAPASGSSTCPQNGSSPGIVVGCSSSKSLRRQTVKECHLATVVGSARRCFKQLGAVKTEIASLICRDGQGLSHLLLSNLGDYVMSLAKQAFGPAHRLYVTALGLHMSEDLIRNPKDSTLLNFRIGPIVRPDWKSIIHTQMKLRTCVDSATELYHRFGRDAVKAGSHSVQVERMQHVMVTLMHAFQDLYATALGSNDIFKVLLHIEDYGEELLQEFLISLDSTERTDLLTQVQSLRRSFDDIVILLEQLSWTAFAVRRLAAARSLTPSPDCSKLRITTPPFLDAAGRCHHSSSRLDANGNPADEHWRPSHSNVKGSRSRETSRSRDKTRPLNSQGSSHLGRQYEEGNQLVPMTSSNSSSNSYSAQHRSGSKEKTVSKNSELKVKKSHIPTLASPPRERATKSPSTSPRESKSRRHGDHGYSAHLSRKLDSKSTKHRDEKHAVKHEKTRKCESGKRSSSRETSGSSVRADGKSRKGESSDRLKS